MNLYQTATNLRRGANAFIAITNDGDVDAALKLFAPDALIDDPSTGHCFEGHAGIRAYIEQFFVGYHTVTRLLSLEYLSAGVARVRLDFTGRYWTRNCFAGPVHQCSRGRTRPHRSRPIVS